MQLGSWGVRGAVRLCCPCCWYAYTGVVTLGVMPPMGTVSWLESPPVESGMHVREPVAPSSAVTIPVLPGGGYMGEGLLPIPDRMVKQILDLAFVEMRDLMPEVWLRDEDETGGSRNVLVLPRKQSALIDITQWTQCFAGYVSVLAMRYPKYVPEMMAYLHGY